MIFLYRIWVKGRLGTRLVFDCRYSNVGVHLDRIRAKVRVRDSVELHMPKNCGAQSWIVLGK